MITVETTGAFQLYDRHNLKIIPAGKPVEVEETPFVRERIGTGELRVVAVEVTPEPEPEPEPEQKPKAKRGAKPEAE